MEGVKNRTPSIVQSDADLPAGNDRCPDSTKAIFHRMVDILGDLIRKRPPKKSVEELKSRNMSGAESTSDRTQQRQGRAWRPILRRSLLVPSP